LESHEKVEGGPSSVLQVGVNGLVGACSISEGQPGPDGRTDGGFRPSGCLGYPESHQPTCQEKCTPSPQSSVKQYIPREGSFTGLRFGINGLVGTCSRMMQPLALNPVVGRICCRVHPKDSRDQTAEQTVGLGRLAVWATQSPTSQPPGSQTPVAWKGQGREAERGEQETYLSSGETG